MAEHLAKCPRCGATVHEGKGAVEHEKVCRDTEAAEKARARIAELEAEVKRLGQLATIQREALDAGRVWHRDSVARIANIKREWQAGVGELDTPWRRRMAELIGDTEGLAEEARET